MVERAPLAASPAPKHSLTLLPQSALCVSEISLLACQGIHSLSTSEQLGGTPALQAALPGALSSSLGPADPLADPQGCRHRSRVQETHLQERCS